MKKLFPESPERNVLEREMIEGYMMLSSHKCALLSILKREMGGG